MNYVTISRKTVYSGVIKACSGQLDDAHAAASVLSENGYWSTPRNASIVPEYIIIDYGNAVPVNRIEVGMSPAGRVVFPTDFRIEGSLDGKSWKVLRSEKKIEMEEGDTYSLDMPITIIRYVRLLILKHHKTGMKYYSEIGSISASIAGVRGLTASSQSASNHPVQNLLEGEKQSFWESETRQGAEQESLEMDLGRPFHINRIALGVADSVPHGFPENFVVEASIDGSIWVQLIDEKGFEAQRGATYAWDVLITEARFIRMEMVTTALDVKAYASRIRCIEVSGAPMNFEHAHNIGEMTPHASVFQPGVVRLAKDGESERGAVVQSNDTRLREASTIFKGIVQLAGDGDTTPGLAIQASDSRFRNASETESGIVRLAHDRETSPGAVVQGSDSRLKEATEHTFGIVRICPDGVYSEMGLVRGSDSRLRRATAGSEGICRLAEDGEVKDGCAVQGSDRRLRDAGTLSKGIVELAEDGEDATGVVVQGSDRRLRDATTISKGIVELAEDGEEADCVVVQGSDRRLRDATTISKGIVELAEDGEDREGVAVQGSDRRLRNATVNSRGIVELANDGEELEGVAVQGNDRRLRNATTTSKGIVELANDGEELEGVAVQGNDRRLRNSTTTSKGIVELADDGEDAPGVAVQGSDRRLKNATTSAKGIVELAEDGEDRPGVAVQGNDRRLKDSTEVRKGILRFAKDGEDVPGAAVQGNDRRLKNATPTSKGIVELAEDGEDAAGVAVQGNDRRLKNATTKIKGIVELAEDGEDAAGVVVQGSDRRLRTSSVDMPGIVRLAKDGEIAPGAAVQGNDCRLSDSRNPLPHTHDYAPLVHDFSGHTGPIHLAGSMSERFSGITPPPEESAVIYAKNRSVDSGAAGLVGVVEGGKENVAHTYGVLGHGRFIGVRGQSSGGTGQGAKGCGVLGVSRFGAGGVFASEHDYSLIVDGFGAIADVDDTVNLAGNGQALRVTGRSDFSGQVHLSGKPNDTFPAGIVEIFEVEDTEYVSPGDLLVVSEAGGGVLARSKAKYSRAVVGVVSGNPVLVIDNTRPDSKKYPVALSGRALCKVDARQRAVKPGDLIVTSDTPGCGMAGDMDSMERIGTVVGKALDRLDEGIGIIPVFLVHL